MNEIRIILLCGGRFALDTIRELIFLRLLVTIAVPEESEEMMENLQAVLQGSGVPLLSLKKEFFASQLRQAMDEQRVNLGLVLGFSYKIPAVVYDYPIHGFYNVHPGPLPAYRGADPVFQQIKNREKFAGATLHRIDKGMDSGPVVMEETIPLEEEDTHGMLVSKLALAASRLCQVLIRILAYGIVPPVKPQDEGHAHYYKKQGAAEVVIDWGKMDGASIVALANACNPWNKGAVTRIGDRIIRILAARKIYPEEHENKTPGTILGMDDNGMRIQTLYGEAIEVKLFYTEEGFMLATDIARLGINPGSVFVPV